MRSLILCVATALILSACGQPLCVGPFGRKEECYQQAGDSGGSSSGGTLQFALQTGVVATQLPKSTPITVTAVGGAPPYRWIKFSGNGTLSVGTGGTQDGSYFVGDTVIFTSSESEDTNEIRLEDTNSVPLPILLKTVP